MLRIPFILILILLNIIIERHSSEAIQSLDDFFPFGPEADDIRMIRNDDKSLGPIPLPYIFPYFDNNHRQIYQANNGLFSFLGGISTYNPIEFPIGNNQRLITPFWSDIDTRGVTSNISENAVYYQVHVRNANNSSNVTAFVFDKATRFVRQYFPREQIFEPMMVITGTWYRVGYCCTHIDRLNTFQMALITDQSRSFAFFFYNDLQWASPSSNGPYAQAGFNAGDGVVSKMLKYSRTGNITLLVNESNVNVPGLFAFRIDTTDIEAGGCNEHESLTHLPVRGPQIGDTTINLQGPCFDSNTTEVLCRFGEFGTVNGMILNEFRAVCVSPLATYPGNVELTVSLDGGNTFVSSGTFTYMPMTNDVLINEEIILRQNGTATQAVSWGDTIELEWVMSEALFAGIDSDALIDIEYESLIPDEESTRRRQKDSNADVDIKIDKVITLASNIRPQVGRQTIQIDLAEIARKQPRIIPLAGVAVGAIRVGIFVYRAYKIYRAVKTAIKIIKATAEVTCDIWSSTQPNPSTWNQNLPPCPNTLRQAQVARAQYVPDPACKDGGFLPSFIPVVGNCWFHQGRPQFQEDNAAACFRSVQSNQHGAGGQCCYNTAGQIITRGTGAGSDDRYHSDKTFWKHQFHDVATFVACCKLQSNPEQCDKYLQHRPSRPGSDTMGQFGGTWGDPHFLTLDGTAYTFNGYGEYIYLAVPLQQTISYNFNTTFRFESQIRTTPIGSGAATATAIKAFAVRIGMQKLAITVSRRNQLLILLNNDELIFETDQDTSTNLDLITFRFEEFFISKNRTNNQLTLVCAQGVSIQITPVYVATASTMVLNIGAAISGELKGEWTLGLIGSYDGNPLNDLRDRSGVVIGTVDELSSQEIHEQFGMTWAIDPTRSLFFYESGDNASFYSFQNQNYRPMFNALIVDSDNANARDACEIPHNATDSSQWSTVQRTCYYDIVVTGDIDFGRTSRQAAEQQIEQREAMRNPPKFNSGLSLTRSVQIGEEVRLSFRATSEFSSSISYKLLRAPNDASLNAMTGEFQWKVSKKLETTNQIPVQVSAQDTVFNLTSTYEVLLQIQEKSKALSRTSCMFLLIFTFVCRVMLS
ncbi:unnamed protein product [Adineta ricciae]|uniref:Uncharacterized protein n=1 Tax=Adineta ricciae TaxID=249248 RepID=A0A815F1M9_ADIRI|nr:unnamed protein product [Adineta ricciae]CAF1319775.1 unnamed protein product [Adineta ricciae]